MSVAAIFSQHIACRMDGEWVNCPATQDAIDRIVAAERFRGRAGMLEALQHPDVQARMLSSFMEAWKDQDLRLATGRGRDWWIDLSNTLWRRDHGLSESRNVDEPILV